MRVMISDIVLDFYPSAILSARGLVFPVIASSAKHHDGGLVLNGKIHELTISTRFNLSRSVRRMYNN